MLSIEQVCRLLTAEVKLQLGVVTEAVSMKSNWNSELNVAFVNLQIDPSYKPGDRLQEACLPASSFSASLFTQTSVLISSRASSSQQISTANSNSQPKPRKTRSKNPNPKCRSQSVLWSPSFWVNWLYLPFSLTLTPISKLNPSSWNLSLILGSTVVVSRHEM